MRTGVRVGERTGIRYAVVPPSVPSGGFAVTAVSGTVSDSNSITISGAQFGSSPTVEIFDDFSGGTLGANILTGAGSAKYGQWDARDASGSSYYGNGGSHSGSLALECDYSVHYSNWIQKDLSNPTTQIFISWWLYLPAGDNYPGEGGSAINWKQMWIQGSSTTDDDLVIPTRLTYWLINGNDSQGYPQPGIDGSPDINFVKGVWKRIWCWLDGNTAGQSDGTIQMWTLESGGVNVAHDDQAAEFLKSGGLYERVRPNGFGNQSSNCFPNWDDIYIAIGPNARARVEIGNNATYNNCTNLTILTPTEWSSTSITAQVNIGNFTSGTAYLFVTDSNGLTTTGYPITVT